MNFKGFSLAENLKGNKEYAKLLFTVVLLFQIFAPEQLANQTRDFIIQNYEMLLALLGKPIMDVLDYGIKKNV